MKRRPERPPLRGLEIRPAVEADFEAIYEITVAAFGPYTVSKLLEDRYGQIAGRPWQAHKGEGVVAGCRLGYVLVAERQGTVVGYATWRQDETVGVVGNNAVHPDLQGWGIGTALISAVVERLREDGATLLEVSTLEHDLPARRVYGKLGFRETGRTVLLSRLRDGEVEQTALPAEASDALARQEGEGWERIAVSVHYERGS